MLKWLGGGDARDRPPRRVAVIDAAGHDAEAWCSSAATISSIS
jgi:hypothetical protein